MIEKITGEAWSEFLASRIFQPLGMTAARMTDDRAIVPNRASGYVMENGRMRQEEWTAQTWNSTADGSLYLNILDLAKWNHALITGKLLKQSNLNRMWTVFPLKDGKPNPGSYGFGFVINSVNGHRVIEHEGNWQGFHDYSALYPDDGLDVTVLTNLGYPLSRPRDIAKGVVGLYKAALRMPDLLPVPDTHPAVTERLRTVLGSVIAGSAKPEEFTSEMLEQLKDMAPIQQWLGRQGPISDFRLVGENTRGGLQEHRYRVRTSERIITFIFVLNPAGRIAQISLSS